MADDLTPAVCSPWVGTVFEVLDEGGRVVLTLTLDTIVDHVPVPGAPRAQPFSLVFLGPLGGYLSQRTYLLRHSDLGDLHIFLVPLGPRADGHHQYEASFN